jgi:hypothetical protein
MISTQGGFLSRDFWSFERVATSQTKPFYKRSWAIADQRGTDQEM